MYRYNGFTEIDGVFVPVPGLCHPALIEIADLIRSIDEDYFLTDTPALTFTKSRVVGTRWDGVDISWDVWIDQFGRAISSTSYAMN